MALAYHPASEEEEEGREEEEEEEEEAEEAEGTIGWVGEENDEEKKGKEGGREGGREGRTILAPHGLIGRRRVLQVHKSREMPPVYINAVGKEAGSSTLPPSLPPSRPPFLSFLRTSTG